MSNQAFHTHLLKVCQGLSLPLTILTTLFHTSLSLFWPEMTQTGPNILREASSIPHISVFLKYFPFWKYPCLIYPSITLILFKAMSYSSKKAKKMWSRKGRCWKEKMKTSWGTTDNSGGRRKPKNQLPCKRKDIISFVEKVIQRNNGKSESWGKAHLYKITVL